MTLRLEEDRHIRFGMRLLRGSRHRASALRFYSAYKTAIEKGLASSFQRQTMKYLELRG